MTVFEVVMQLKAARVFHTISSIREGALLIDAALPGERWEIEVFKDGHIEIERYRSDGEIADETALAELFARASEVQ